MTFYIKAQPARKTKRSISPRTSSPPLPPTPSLLSQLTHLLAHLLSSLGSLILIDPIRLIPLARIDEPVFGRRASLIAGEPDELLAERLIV